MVKIKRRRTQAQTPAPKQDQRKGSAVNPAGSASGTRGNISISDQAVKALEKLRDTHNARFTKRARRVDLGMLKAVYRRGAGAFSVSHRPGMNRNQWALARVKTFLKLVATGQRKRAYTTDLDLLPKDHPQHTSAEQNAELMTPKRYAHINFRPPKGVQSAAARALKVRASKPPSQRGMTSTGIARARDLQAGRELSPETVRRMLSYFQRHEVDKQGSTWSAQGKGWQAWHAWGGDAGYTWAQKVVNQMNKADESSTVRSYGEATQVTNSQVYDAPEGLVIGKPFKTLSLGQVSSRVSGDKVGTEVDLELLSEILRVYQERKEQDPVIIDWQHSTSPYNSGPPAPPETGNALGMIVDLELRSDGLYAVPAYNERGLEVVQNAGGVLWSSPEFLTGDVYDRSGGAHIGKAQLLAITLTPRPAQSHDKIERVTLNERLDEMDNLSPEEMAEMISDLKQQNKQLEDKIAEMKADAESAIKSDVEERKEKEEEDKEESSKLAHSKDHDYNKMSESHVSMYAEKISLLEEQIAAMTKENNAIKRNEAVSTLLSEGKISPAEQSVAAEAWDHREILPNIWAHFSERQPSQAVPLREIGHGASGAEINQQALVSRAHQLKEELNLSSLQDAYKHIHANDPEFYKTALLGGQ